MKGQSIREVETTVLDEELLQLMLPREGGSVYSRDKPQMVIQLPEASPKHMAATLNKCNRL